MRTVIVRPSAKVNLTLRVGPIRPDGFHDVRTLLQSIGIADTLTVSARRGPFAFDCRAPGVPTDETNLVWRAARALWTAAGREGEPRDAHVRLDKVIPHEAGLGGGSADAAGALNALNLIWETKQSRKELHRVAATIGADVPFFLLGGTALGAGKGDELYPVDDLARLGVVIVKPSFGVATADAYRWLDEDRAAGVTALATERSREVHVGWETDPLVISNDLEAPVVRRRPEILEVIEACYREGAQVAAMTGSGSAVFALFSETVAPRAARGLQRPDWLVSVTRTLTRREASRRIGQS
jgi:4-diphosphocytidyl-2-C-methyl-D-erythritol kinase